MPFVKEALALFLPFPSDQKLRVYDPAAGDGRLLEAFRELYPNFDYCFSEILADRYAECQSKGFTGLQSDMHEVINSESERWSMDVILTNLPFLEDNEEQFMFFDLWNWLLKPGGVIGIFLNPELKTHNFFPKFIETVRRVSRQTGPYELNFAPICKAAEGDCTKPLWFVLLHKIK